MRIFSTFLICYFALSGCSTLGNFGTTQNLNYQNQNMFNEGKISSLETDNTDLLDVLLIFPAIIDGKLHKPANLTITSIDNVPVERIDDWSSNAKLAIEPGLHEIQATCIFENKIGPNEPFYNFGIDFETTGRIEHNFIGGEKYLIFVPGFLGGGYEIDTGIGLECTLAIEKIL